MLLLEIFKRMRLIVELPSEARPSSRDLRAGGRPDAVLEIKTTPVRRGIKTQTQHSPKSEFGI